MSILIVLGILFLHWVADFVCQTTKMALGKSNNWEDLLNHTMMYTLIFTLASLAYSVVTDNYLILILFPFITFICHTATDYFSSRISKKYWEQKSNYKFFVTIGADQWLHYVQLLLTFYYLS